MICNQCGKRTKEPVFLPVPTYTHLQWMMPFTLRFISFCSVKCRIDYALRTPEHWPDWFDIIEIRLAIERACEATNSKRHARKQRKP